MVKTFKATIVYDCKAEHPDCPNARRLRFEDTYRFDTNIYGGDGEDMISYMKHDLALVAGGGYETNTIKNVSYNITEV